eukprot:tig00020552_g10481.t2
MHVDHVPEEEPAGRDGVEEPASLQELPDDVFHLILAHLSALIHLAAAGVCRRWRAAAFSAPLTTELTIWVTCPAAEQAEAAGPERGPESTRHIRPRPAAAAAPAACAAGAAAAATAAAAASYEERPLPPSAAAAALRHPLCARVERLRLAVEFAGGEASDYGGLNGVAAACPASLRRMDVQVPYEHHAADLWRALALPAGLRELAFFRGEGPCFPCAPRPATLRIREAAQLPQHGHASLEYLFSTLHFGESAFAAASCDRLRGLYPSLRGVFGAGGIEAVRAFAGAGLLCRSVSICSFGSLKDSDPASIARCLRPRELPVAAADGPASLLITCLHPLPRSWSGLRLPGIEDLEVRFADLNGDLLTWLWAGEHAQAGFLRCLAVMCHPGPGIELDALVPVLERLPPSVRVEVMVLDSWSLPGIDSLLRALLDSPPLLARVRVHFDPGHPAFASPSPVFAAFAEAHGGFEALEWDQPARSLRNVNINI